MGFDLIVRNGLYFDGSGAEGLLRHVGVRAGRIACVSAERLDEAGCGQVVEAGGCWVTPGFLDIHSHYDAELMAAPGLRESVRHGVTTVAVGSCSISMVNAGPEECSDLFTRVEALPREAVLPLLRRRKDWSTAAGYRRFLERVPLGPNVCFFLGHSDMRVAVMGLERATSMARPEASEMRRMEALLGEALDAGCLGLSVMTARFDKMDGEVAWSRPLPSTFAGWGERSRLFRVLRRRGAVLQAAPDAVAKSNLLGFLWHGTGLGRAPLRLTMITAMDLKAHPAMHLGTRALGWIVNRVLGGDFRWQVLPAPLEIHSDGLDMGAFEEFAAGEMLRDIRDPERRYARPADPEFRTAFRQSLRTVLGVGLWHRDFNDGWVVACPDAGLIGRNFAEIGASRGVDAIDAFLDLAMQYRDGLRWRTCMGNHRPEVMRKLLRSPCTQVGFADSGAHIRALACYNFPLRFLRYVREAALAGRPFMGMGRAVRRLSGELADWFGLEAGYIRPGDRADLVVVNPLGLDARLDVVSEAPMEGFGVSRLVNRNDAAVEATIINGRVAYRRGAGFTAGFGLRPWYGRFLAARRVSGA